LAQPEDLECGGLTPLSFFSTGPGEEFKSTDNSAQFKPSALPRSPSEMDRIYRIDKMKTV
jgi:hypothetical protein